MSESVSQYPSFLVFLAFTLTVVLTAVLMPFWIKFLKSSHIGQQVRADGPESHLVKQGTPTMGGVIMLLAVLVLAVYGACKLGYLHFAYCNYFNGSAWLC